MKRALVTGGAGFLGSHLVDRLLADGYFVGIVDDLSTGKIENLDTRRVRCWFVDIVDNARVDRWSGQWDEIYHLACPASPVAYDRDRTQTLRTCFEGTRNVLEMTAKCDARVLLTSTSEVYGDPLEHPQREDYRGNVSCDGPRSCYDEGKRVAEALCAAYAAQQGVDVRVARIFNTYGPRMRPDDGRVVSNFVRQALRGEPLTIYGDGGQTRSLCYVDDTVEGLVRLMASDVSEPVNVGNPHEVTVRTLANEVRRACGEITCKEIVCRPLPKDDPARRKPDISRARECLDWEPKVDLEEGLRRTVAWFRSALK